MKAIVYRRYGPPEVLHLEEVAKPAVKDHEVLVRVHAASVNPADWHLVRGEPFLLRLMGFGLLKPRNKVPGCDMAGRVEAVASAVKQFQQGDDVFGDLAVCGFGAFAEYVSVPEDAVALKPAGMTFEEAAAVPLAAVTALQGLRDMGHVEPGQRVLINGAGGGVGTFAVQIAKSFGAEVAGVCSTNKLGMVRSLGADHVIDYTQGDLTRNAQRYDLILDTAAYRSIFDYTRALASSGIYVLVGGSTAALFQAMMLGPLASMTGSKKMRLLTAKTNKKDLLTVKGLIESGKLKPVIGTRYRLTQVPEALLYLEEGHSQGKIVINIEPDTKKVVN